MRIVKPRLGTGEQGLEALARSSLASPEACLVGLIPEARLMACLALFPLFLQGPPQSLGLLSVAVAFLGGHGCSHGCDFSLFLQND